MGNTQALACCNQSAAQSDKLSEVVPPSLEKEYQAEDVEATQAAEDISTDAPPSSEEAAGEPLTSDAQAAAEQQPAPDAQPWDPLELLKASVEEEQQQPVSEPQQPQEKPVTQELSTEEVQPEKVEGQVVSPKVQDEDQAKSDSKKAKPAKSRGWCLCGSKAGIAVAADRTKQVPAKDSKDDAAAEETVKVVV
jgi:hypothetical protein